MLYLKTGNKTAEERKMLRALNQYETSHPDVKIKPPKTFSKLKSLYEKYIVETVGFEEKVGTETQANTHGETETTGEILDDGGDSSTGVDESETVSQPNTGEDDVIDPWKKDPVIREHVLRDARVDATDTPQPQKTDFDEPKSFKDQFDIPENYTGGGSLGDKKDQSQNQSGENKKQPKQQPLNPEFDTMSKQMRNRKTRRMAKNIVKIFSILLKEGVPKWATRDITPEALARQAKEKSINLDLLLTFDGETQIHIVEYFKQMCEVAKSLGEVPEELLTELEEDLYDLFIEKGVTPTPLQSTLLTLGAIAAHVGLKTYGFRIQVSSVMDIARSGAEKTVDVTHEEVKTPTKDEKETGGDNQEEQTEKQPPQPPHKKKKSSKKPIMNEGDFGTQEANRRLEIGAETKE